MTDPLRPAQTDPPPAAAASPGSAPLRQFILKVHGRCDLACDYCYLYRLGEQRWRDRPPVMSRHVVDRTADRIAEHAERHGLSAIELVLHGGEPLLAGADRLAYTVRRVRAAVGPDVTVRVAIQTNGVRLDRRFLDLFRQLDVGVGVSVDGGRELHDRHRRDHRGRGSYRAVSRALALLAEPRYRRQYLGLLCTVDLDNDPVRVYEELLAFRPPAIDLLLPHGSWSGPPPGRDPRSADAPYGRWLVAVFDRWYDAPARETGIRLFEEVIRLLFGRASRLEGIGSGPAASIVVETDGAIVESDHLVAVSGQGATGLTVTTDDFDAALRLPLARARRGGLDSLSPACRSCPVLEVCGGGLFSHRYRAGDGFRNPSVYCRDLRHLIDHVHHRLIGDVRRLAGSAA
ncbi:FxsB family cyclophane-forming radical SAM/SPASM peptide maturase [Micromonospora sp. HK10]|uniref:FxsB family cyclophane-forming radical SAM/SPASM peptide maturase n=1 Tax=Micromonospora sp. HK10 TaxID=1538294 RepID=UPI0009E3EBC3|nr:FxsB family cyclophane-forming radical SAM/SPASM peptide maturase [Micromonospora sp. HK10]